MNNHFSFDVICPYCGKTEEDPETIYQKDDDSEIDCGYCEKSYNLLRHTQFSTYKLPNDCSHSKMFKFSEDSDTYRKGTAGHCDECDSYILMDGSIR